jgi:5'-nucleotidase
VVTVKFLLSNDDGIDACGLAALERAISEFGPVTVVAPDRHLSGCSHQVNTVQPLLAQEVAPGRYAVDGTPGDCVRLGLLHLAADVDWIVSGINDGGNLGVDVFMSGTVAAAREAALFGKPAIAFSQYRRRKTDFDWSVTAPLVKRVLQALWSRPVQPGTFWNVNFPDLDGSAAVPRIVDCPVDTQNHLPVWYEIQDGRFHYRTAYHDRARTRGADIDVCFSGDIAVSELCPRV